MIRPVLLCTILAGLNQCARADNAESPQRWECARADGASARQLGVVKGIGPMVAFAGEDQHLHIATRMAALKVPAMTVAVIRDGQLDWSAAWGVLYAGGPAAGCDSLFQAGSLAKPVTVLAALRMQQQGLLAFDKDIGTYLRSYQLPAGKQSEAHPVTLRNLLAHTAGVTAGGYQGYAQGQELPTDVQTVRAEPPSNARKVEVVAVPDSALVYSGGGYTVVEIALQDQLRKPFDKIMDEWVLRPLAMRQASFIQPLPPELAGQAARGHLGSGTGVDGGWRNHPEQAAAGLWATASDLASFLIELRKGYQGHSMVFTQAMLRELMATPFAGHVYGFRLIGQGEQVFITHYGGTTGYSAGMTMNLRTGDGAVYLCNSENGATLGGEFFNAVARVYHWPVFQEEVVTRVSQTAALLQSLTGRYLFESKLVVAVVMEQGVLTLVFPNGDRYAMSPIKGEALEFIHVDTGVRASFDNQQRLHLYGQLGVRELAASTAK